MVMLNCSYTSLKQALGRDISEEELRSVLFDMGYELDTILGDELAIEITAERLDVLSVQGMARAMKSFSSAQAIKPYIVRDSNQVVRITQAVSSIRPHTVCAIVKNLRLTEENIKEIIEVQEKLHATLCRGRRRGAIGIYPLEHITLPITFDASTPDKIKFNPLEAEQEMSAVDILQDHPTGKMYGHLLSEYDLFPFFHDGKGEILSLPPVINSEKTGRVTTQTTDVFIECSGHELDILDELLVYITTMFSDMGGDVYSMKVAYPDGSIRTTPDLSYVKKTLHTSTIKKYLGIELTENDLDILLSKMMYTVVSKQKSSSQAVLTQELDTIYTLLAPPFRKDLWHEIDIVDDVARAYGYNKLPLTLPQVVTTGGTLKLSRFVDEMANVMVGLGFLETYTFALSGKKEQIEQMNLEEEKLRFVSIVNGNEVQTMLRISLLPQQLTSLAINRKYSLPQKIFELAHVVHPDSSKDVKAVNSMHFSAMITDKVVSFTQIKQVLDAALASRGLHQDIRVEQIQHPSFLKGRVGKVYYKDTSIGIIGELHPQVLDNFGIMNPVACFELHVDRLV